MLLQGQQRGERVFKVALPCSAARDWSLASPGMTHSGLTLNKGDDLPHRHKIDMPLQQH